MRRGTNYRIGICPAMMKSDILGIGARMRMNQEKADAVWILDVFDTRKEALQQEMYYSYKYNIPMILFNQRHNENSYSQEFIDNIDSDKEKELISIGSSLKICLVAEGEADIYPRLGPTMEWDTGAAHAVVIESGKNLKKYKNGKYSKHEYNKESLLNEWFVVNYGI